MRHFVFATVLFLVASSSLMAEPCLHSVNLESGLRDLSQLEIKRFALDELEDVDADLQKMIQVLKLVKSIGCLELGHGNCNDAHLTSCASLPVKRICVSTHSVQGFGFDAWRDSKTLEELSIHGISAEMLEHIYSLENLKSLYITCNNLTPDGLQRLQKLKHLSLSTSFETIPWDQMVELPALQTLHLDVDDTWNPIKVMEMKSEDIANFRGLKRLRTLEIGVRGPSLSCPVQYPWQPSGRLLEAITMIPHLKELSLPRAKLDRKHLGILAHSPQLESLHLACGEFESDSFDGLADFPRLRCLDLSYSQRLPEGWGNKLAKIPNLRQLEFRSVRKIHFKELVTLLNSTKLEALDLSGTELSEELTQGLKEVPTLRFLNLANSKTKFSSLKPIARAFPNLESLDMLDVELQGIGELPSLRVLRISRNDPEPLLDEINRLKHLHTLSLDPTTNKNEEFVRRRCQELRESRRWRYIHWNPYDEETPPSWFPYGRDTRHYSAADFPDLATSD